MEKRTAVFGQSYFKFKFPFQSCISKMKVRGDTEKVAKVKNKKQLIDDLMFGETDANQILE